jgi:hypothetical protein
MVPSEGGVTKAHIGQIVDTAGWVNVVWAADEQRLSAFNGGGDVLPPGLRFVLKDVDEQNRAWLYRMDTGVVAIPAHVMDPWGR